MLVNNSPQNNREDRNIFNKDVLIKLSKGFGFEIDFERERNSLVRFKRDECTDECVRIDVWYTSMTVGVYSKLFTKTQGARYFYNVSMENLAEVFSDPYGQY